MPSGFLVEDSTHRHRACVLLAKCVALMKRTGQTNKRGQKRLKIFQLLNLSFKI